MKIKSSKVEDIIYKVHRDVPKLDLKKGINAYHSVKYYNHDLNLKLRNIEVRSVKTETSEMLMLRTADESLVFKRKDDPYFTLQMLGDGDMIKSVLETCANYEMQSIEHDLYILDGRKLYYAEPHLEGYLLKDTEGGDCSKFLSSKDMYELYAKYPHTIMEEKMILLKGGIQ